MFEKPEYSQIAHRSLLIPFRKEEKQTIDFLTKEDFNALFESCDNNNLGERDKVMILLLYNTGIRVSKLTTLRLDDINIDSEYKMSYIKISGKGRKKQSVPLWKNTAKLLNKYIEKYTLKDNTKLFINNNGNNLTKYWS